MFASLPFGATAIATLSAFGGATPLIFTVFVMALLVAVMTRARFLDELVVVFKRYWVPWLVLALMIYTFAGALILPRLFSGQLVFIPIRGEIMEAPLAPTTGNFTQALYFTLDGLAFFAFCIILTDKSAVRATGYGFVTFAVIQVTLGALVLFGKLIGIVDVLEPLRTAGYAMLTEEDAAGFWRISGGFPEASSYAATSVACLAYVVTYWRQNGSTFMLVIALPQLVLLLFSTSSTGYVSLSILAILFLLSLMWSAMIGRVSRRDLALAGIALCVSTVMLAVYLHSEKSFEPFVNLLNSMVLEKGSSDSAIERSHWNAISLQAFTDTAGLGIGIGSSRCSSIVVAVLSQLGIMGSLMFVVLIGFLLRGMGGRVLPYRDKDIFAIAQSARAAALAVLIPASMTSPSADPGVVFFISLAVLLSCREHATLVERDTAVALEALEPRGADRE
jgi:hypothetical protein